MLAPPPPPTCMQNTDVPGSSGDAAGAPAVAVLHAVQRLRHEAVAVIVAEVVCVRLAVLAPGVLHRPIPSLRPHPAQL